MRDYGTDKKPLALAFKPSPKGSVMRILVFTKGSTAVEQSPAALSFGSNRLNANLLRYSDDKNHFRIVSLNVPMSELKANRGVSSISIDGGGLDETFVLTDFSAVVSELDKCILDLQNYWNIGDQYAARISSKGTPKTPIKGLFSSSDYPWMALVQNEQGSVTLTFLVDEKGEVADCSVDGTSGIPALDTMSCYVVQNRAHFSPAFGADGKPIRSAYTQTINWRIASF
jgi:TonB family protein